MNIRALLRILYVIFSYLLLPLIFFHLAYKGFSDRDYFKRIGERFGFNGNPLAESIVWVHAVSYGEVKAASILITELKRKYPEKKYEYILRVNKKIKNIVLALYLENEKIFNYNFQKNIHPQTRNVIGIGVNYNFVVKN